MTMSLTIPRLLLAASMSGSGKTTIMAGLIAALTHQHLRVAPFKVGPDYIDPSYHTLAAGRPCHTLDAWMLPPSLIPALLARQSADADLALIEGVMGLFDGVSGNDDTGSSAHIARLTRTPVVLVLDVRSQARTAAALVSGLQHFDSSLHIAGVILNRVGSPNHAHIITTAIEETTGLPVLGALPRTESLSLPERHLGLVPTSEPGQWPTWLAHAQTVVCDHIDLKRLRTLANAAPPLSYAPLPPPPTLSPAPNAPPILAIAQDAAFSFHYPENLDLLRQAGAQLVPCSPLCDSSLPTGTQALYLCGGFPELYAAQLAHNSAFRQALAEAAQYGLPIYAECGGLMYLTEQLLTDDDHTYPMSGVLPGISRMTNRLTLGYRTIQPHTTTWLLHVGETVRGHEFHYSTWEQPSPSLPPAYTILPDHRRSEPRTDGAHYQNVIASYIHLHFLAFPQLATRFVHAAAQYRPESVP